MDSKPNLANIDKFNYLRSKLEGEALQVIRGTSTDQRELYSGSPHAHQKIRRCTTDNQCAPHETNEHPSDSQPVSEDAHSCWWNGASDSLIRSAGRKHFRLVPGQSLQIETTAWGCLPTWNAERAGRLDNGLLPQKAGHLSESECRQKSELCRHWTKPAMP